MRSDVIYQFVLGEHLPIVYPLITMKRVFDWRFAKERGQCVSPSLFRQQTDWVMNVQSPLAGELKQIVAMMRQ